jgi:hypothetical protein
MKIVRQALNLNLSLIIPAIPDWVVKNLMAIWLLIFNRVVFWQPGKNSLDLPTQKNLSLRVIGIVEKSLEDFRNGLVR